MRTDFVRAALGLAAAMSLAASSSGGLYRITVSREAQNLYRVDYTSREIYIKTRYCYVYAYFEEAIVDDERMVIHFLDSGDDCDIARILAE